MKENELIPNLFRTEYSKIVAVLCKTFGISNIQLAEDVVSETFLTASETWGLKGVPNNPKAWLYTVAKNKTKDVFKRNALFTNKISVVLKQEEASSTEIELDLSENNIQDSQLKMLFAVCNPMVSTEAQISLALKFLCGFGIEEIANAFLTSKQTINKRLQRAKKKFREQKIDFSKPIDKKLQSRLPNVLSVLYLLFNEGYFSQSKNQKIRKNLCFEAMQQLHLLIENKEINLAQTNALMALFCFQSSRFEARTTTEGEQILYKNQNTAHWNTELIEKGNYFLALSAQGNQISKYHLESLIAFWHTKPEDSKEKWESILQLYNQLIQIEYSPITALNRTYALSKAHNKKEAIQEALKINLQNNYLYFCLLADLYNGVDKTKELEYLQKALVLAKTITDKKFILKKLTICEL